MPGSLPWFGGLLSPMRLRARPHASLRRPGLTACHQSDLGGWLASGRLPRHGRTSIPGACHQSDLGGWLASGRLPRHGRRPPRLARVTNPT